MKKVAFVSALVGLAGLTLTACHQSSFHASTPVKMATASSCPTPTQVTTDMKQLTPIPIQVKKVSPSVIAGLCQVEAKVNGMPNVFYISKDGKYFVPGNIIDLATKKNLTQEAQMKMMAMNKDDMKILEQDTAFTYYNGKSYYTNVPQTNKYIYMISDPKCPFCHHAEPIVQKWADKNNVAIKVIMDPLPIHPGSKQTSIGLYCAKKGWNSFHDAYNSKKPLAQCEEGEKYIDKSTQDMMKLGIMGTPTFVCPNGQVHVGMPMNEGQMDTWCKSE
ncbi:MAG: DsbC family protein [Candidatus Nanopusillus acidilobi]